MFRILLTFAIGIVGFGHPMTRAKLAPPFPIYIGQDLERVSKMVKKSTTAEFIAKAIKKHPNIDFGKVRYVNAVTDISLVCKTCGNEWDATPNSILNGSGCPHCGRTKLVLGVGINDVPTPTRSGNIRNDAYRIWKSMLERCYSDKYHQKEPAYIGCSVCDDWIRFSNFKSKDWYDNEYIRTLRYYLSRYCAREISNPNLDPYRQIIRGDFVLYKIEPFILGGAFIQFVFFKEPEKLFTSWVYSEVDEERQVVLSYEVRDVRVEDEDTGLSQDEILRIMSEHPELKYW